MKHWQYQDQTNDGKGTQNESNDSYIDRSVPDPCSSPTMFDSAIDHSSRSHNVLLTPVRKRKV